MPIHENFKFSTHYWNKRKFGKDFQFAITHASDILIREYNEAIYFHSSCLPASGVRLPSQRISANYRVQWK